MVLRCDLSRFEAHHKGNRVAVLHALSEINGSRRAGFPPWKLVSIGNSTVQYVYRAAPNVEVVKLRAGPRLATEHLEWAPTGVFAWNSVEKVHCVKYGKWPNFYVSYIWPVDGRMVQHRSGDGHYCGDSTLGDTVGMMSAYTRMANGLFELLQVSFVVLVDERSSIVAEIGLSDYPMCGTHLFERLLGFQGLV